MRGGGVKGLAQGPRMWKMRLEADVYAAYDVAIIECMHMHVWMDGCKDKPCLF